MERYTFSTTASASGRTLTGTAYAFGQRTLRDGRYIEFAKGAFDKALAKSDIRAFWNHDTTLLLGRESNETVRVMADGEGLKYAIDTPNTSYADDLLVLVNRGDLREMSFGITPGRVTKGRAEDGKALWTYNEVEDLFDISPVSLPAFDGTAIALHSRSDDEPVGSQLVKARHRARTGEK